MDRIVEIEIRKPEKPQYFRASPGIELGKGDLCIVEYTQGTVDSGKVLKILESKPLLKFTLSGKILRKATERDMAVLQENMGKKREAFDICKSKIDVHKLPMKLVDAEYSFDRTRVTFYYWADGRIDFRNLVKDLASVFNCRIEMRQIGLRDEAKMKGGYGICGCELCCAKFLKKFDSVTMRMAKNQKLPLDVNKITGQCGRLLCCLAYEEDQYRKEKTKK